MWKCHRLTQLNGHYLRLFHCMHLTHCQLSPKKLIQCATHSSDCFALIKRSYRKKNTHLRWEGEALLPTAANSICFSIRSREARNKKQSPASASQLRSRSRRAREEAVADLELHLLCKARAQLESSSPLICTAAVVLCVSM